MNFLNVAMLGGMAAVLAPLLIHLLNRSRHKSVDWGAMHLLEAAMQVNSRRFQWESILLLLIRCGIPLLLALCLARPVLTSARIAGTQGRKSIALVIDDSLSMTRQRSPGEILFESAQRELIRLANQFPSAEFSLWTAGVRPMCLTEGVTFDPSRVSATINNMGPSAGSIQAMKAISAAAGQLVGMSNPSKHIVFASDFCESDWANISDSDLATWREQLTSVTPPIQLSLLMLNGQSKSNPAARNLGIGLSEAVEPRLLPDETAVITLAVSNVGPETVNDVSVIFSVDGRDVAQRQVSVPGEASAQSSFACKFTEPAWHLIAVRIEGDTGPDFDDSLHFVVQVTEPTRVLLLTSQRGEAFNPSVDYLKLALMPFEAEQSGLNRFQVEIATAAEITPRELEEQQVIILIGTERLSESTSSLLVEFVRGGGGLIVFPDDNLDVEWFNQRFYEQDQLFPMKFGGTQNNQNAVKLLPSTIQFPELQIFNNTQLAGNLGEWEFENWQHLVEAGDRALVILRLSGGEPFLATQSFGQGRVHQCAVSSHDNWSNIPLKSAFVPFVQQLTLSAAEGVLAANISCGESCRISIKRSESESPELEPSREAPVHVLITQENNSDEAQPKLSRSVEVDASSTSAEWADTRYPGVFRLAARDAASSAATSDRWLIEPPLLSIRRSPSESNLRTMSKTQMQQLADRLGATVVESSEEFSLSDQRRQVGREIWQWLLVASLVLLVAEVFVIRGMARGTAA